MKWKTAISAVNNGNEIVRGYRLHDLMAKKTFTEVIFLTLRGQLPSAAETNVLNTVLNSMIDHGPGVASAHVARFTSSTGNNLYSSIAAGILALGGSRHGGALEGAAKFFQENIETKDLSGLLKKLKEQKMRVPGFGHRVLTHDARTDVSFSVAQNNGIFGKYCAFAQKVEEELNLHSSKIVPINNDGANAAILLDMGFAPAMIGGFFIIGRATGLVAEVYEEMSSGEGLRRIDEEDVEYVGEKDKNI